MYNRIIITLTAVALLYLMYLIYGEYASGGKLAEVAGQANREMSDSTFLAELKQTRYDKDKYFGQAAESPILASDKPSFTGLSYYEPNMNFRVRATFEKETAAPIRLSDGTEQKLAGILTFTLQGKTVSLRAYYDNEPLSDIKGGIQAYVPFRDATSGKDTYGGGRLLNILIEEDNKAILDFNYAYHPFCYYNPAYICPLTPRENTLVVAIKAGEKLGSKVYGK
jgi:uncharacterized protein